MKKIIAIALALVASTASAAVVGSAHDLTGTANIKPGTGSCQFCHMVHNANSAVTAAPIWAKSVRTYTMYGDTVSGTAAPTAIGAISQACMSCHDGTTDAVTTQHNGTTLTTSGGRTVTTVNSLGNSLAEDHPVSIPYLGTSASEAGLVDLATAQGAGFLFFGSDNTLECGSCHDPHDGTAGAAYLLRTAATDVCAECHANK